MNFEITIGNEAEVESHDYEEYSEKKVLDLDRLIEDTRQRMARHLKDGETLVRAVIRFDRTKTAEKLLKKMKKNSIAEHYLRKDIFVLEMGEPKPLPPLEEIFSDDEIDDALVEDAERMMDLASAMF